MKLNFLNVLKSKSTPEEIAEQIVALEEKQKVCEQEKAEAKEKAKEIRSRVMCGERVNSESIKLADLALEECNINLDVVAESLAKLKTKLEEALTAKRDEEAKRIIEDRKQWNLDREKALLELWRAKGKLFALAFAIYGHPETTRRNLESYPEFSPSLGTEEHKVFHSEKDKGITELRHPTIADVAEDIRVRDHWVSHFDLEHEVKALMRKYRPEPVKPAEQTESVAE
ncbi:MAG: hypothetical protein PHI58_03630 [Candidatus Omnitrophica bacterium]|nr:hypothetical protein [Candidatus Omnitrophota bacterium]